QVLEKVAREHDVLAPVGEEREVADVAGPELDLRREALRHRRVQVDPGPPRAAHVVQELAHAAADVEDAVRRGDPALDEALDDRLRPRPFPPPRAGAEAALVHALEVVPAGHGGASRRAFVERLCASRKASNRSSARRMFSIDVAYESRTWSSTPKAEPG